MNDSHQQNGVTFKRPAFAFENITPIPNAIHRNPNLTPGEKGILGYLLSHKAGYGLTIAQLAAENKGGKETLNTQLKGLEEAGFLKRTRLRDSNGRLGRYEWELTMDECGNPTGISHQNQETSAENPSLGLTCENTVKAQVGTSAGFPMVVKPAPYKTTNLKKTKKEERELLPSSVVLSTPQAASTKTGAEIALFDEKTEKKKTQQRASRLPDHFAVTAEMVQWAHENTPSVDGRYETAKFVDYWSAKSGATARKLDWVATWRNWMRTAQDRIKASQGHAAARNGVGDTRAWLERSMERAVALDAAEARGEKVGFWS